MGHGNGYRMGDDSTLFTPTPHSAYVQNCTPRTVEKLMRAVKAQAMKDYIRALSKLREDPHDNIAMKTIAECEQFFDDAGKLKTVRQKIKYDGALFEIVCKEHFPESWGEMLPTGDDAVKCPVCKEGRIGRSFRPSNPAKVNKKTFGRDPHIICACDVCTYKYVAYVWDVGDEYMKQTAQKQKKIALREREILCRQEIHEELKAHPEYSQAEKDEVYRRLANKWKV